MATWCSYRATFTFPDVSSVAHALELWTHFESGRYQDYHFAQPDQDLPFMLHCESRGYGDMESLFFDLGRLALFGTLVTADDAEHGDCSFFVGPNDRAILAAKRLDVCQRIEDLMMSYGQPRPNETDAFLKRLRLLAEDV